MATNIAISVDGGVLEGGGQILRNAAALCSILSKPISIHNIRAGRSKPGLRTQHLSGLELLRDLCKGRLDGAQVGSTSILLEPGTLSAGQFLADTKTAGSICLLIQAALPCMAFAGGPTQVSLRGGTNAAMAPQIDYVTWVLKPTLELFGVHFECNIKKRGYYPRGGGEVLLKVNPVKSFESVNLTDVGRLDRITGRAFVAGVLPIKVAGEMADAAREVLQRRFLGVSIQISVEKEPDDIAVGTGTGIILMASTSTNCRLAGSALGSKGVRADVVGMQAAEELAKNIEYGGCVDEYLQDQLIMLMALARGKSRIKCGPITLHTQTAIHVSQLLTQAKFEIEKVSDTTNIIECTGIAFENNSLLA